MGFLYLEVCILLSIVEDMVNFVLCEFFCVFLLLFLMEIFCFKLVIIVYGIFDYVLDMKDFVLFIIEVYFGINIMFISLFEEVDSFKFMWM